VKVASSVRTRWCLRWQFMWWVPGLSPLTSFRFIPRIRPSVSLYGVRSVTLFWLNFMLSIGEAAR
jgi:hypothetical protein